LKLFKSVLTFANFRVVLFQLRVLVEADLAELALPALRVVGAVVAHAAADVAGGGVDRGVEVASRRVVVAVAF
jgi:hypothetical protein